MAGKPKFSKESGIKVKTYTILIRALEEGISYGYMRAHKHTDEPSPEQIKEAILDGILLSFDEVFTYGDEEE